MYIVDNERTFVNLMGVHGMHIPAVSTAHIKTPAGDSRRGFNPENMDYVIF